VWLNPGGDSDPYDFIIHAGGKLWKVQVKSAHRPKADKGYAFSLERTDERPYSADQIDALAAYIVPDNVWYVFPVDVIARLHAIELFPGNRRKTSKYEKYREAWEMFKARDHR
jgi:PD-(D/E)XK endonuclease